MAGDQHECSVCFTAVSRGTRFCPRCGSPLTPSAVQEAVKAAPPPEPALSASERSRLERAFRAQFEKRGLRVEPEQLEQARAVLLSTEKQVRRASVLFLDLCRFTQISHELGPDRTEELLHEYHTICAQVVYRHHGFIVKFIGDGIVAVFGAPLSYDRDAESCVRAALEIRELVAGLEIGEGAAADVHSGIATGEIFSGVAERAGGREYDIAGDAVNLAARLQARAQAGQTLLCRATALGVQSVFDAEPMPPMRLKNIAGLYAACRVVGEKKTGILRRPIRTRFVGRAAEVRKIHEALERVRSGHVEVIEIVGEPGVGKSRLFAEAAASFAGKATLLAGECAPHAAESLLWPLVELVRKLCGISADDSPATTRERIERFCRDKKMPADDAAAIGYLLGLPEAIEAMSSLPFLTIRRKVFDALVKIVLPQRRDEMRVLCLDDVQWMDDLTREWLEHLLERAAADRLALVLIARSREKPAPKSLCPTVRIRLGPLSQRERTDVVRQIIGRDYAKQAVHEAILDRAGGNPLFLEEVARLAAQLESAKGIPPTEPSQEALAEVVPDSLYSIIQHRIDRLERRTRTVLECGAVLGRRFSFGVIQLFEAIRQNLVEQLAVLRGLRFLEECPPPPDIEYAFLHPLAREVAYSNLPAAQRRALHGQIAAQMERYLGPRVGEYYSALAYHFEKAEDASKALYYTVKSAERAVGLFANREALSHYEKALKWMQAERAKQPAEGEAALVRQSSVLTAIGRLRRILGDVDAAREALERALHLTVNLRNTHLKALCSYELAALHQATSDYSQATQYATEALQLACQQERRTLEAQCRNILGMIAWGRSQYDEGLAQYQAVFDLGVDEACPGVVADAHNNAGLIHWQRGRYTAALEQMSRCLRLGRAMGDRYRIAATVMNMGILQERLGRFAAARRSHENALTLSEEIGFRQAACAAYANLSNLDLIERKPAQALDRAACSREIARAIGDRRSEAIAEENLALGHVLARDFESARTHFDRALKLARTLNDVERQVSIGLGLVELELETNKASAMSRRIQTLLRSIETHGFNDHRPRGLRNLARALALDPETRKEAETALRKALDEAKRLSNVPEQMACRRCLNEIKAQTARTG